MDVVLRIRKVVSTCFPGQSGSAPITVKSSDTFIGFAEKLRGATGSDVIVQGRDIDAYGRPKMVVKFGDKSASVCRGFGPRLCRRPAGRRLAGAFQPRPRHGMISYYIRAVDGCNVIADTNELLSTYAASLAPDHAGQMKP
jgi:hypothetical protein